MPAPLGHHVPACLQECMSCTKTVLPLTCAVQFRHPLRSVVKLGKTIFSPKMFFLLHFATSLAFSVSPKTG